MKVPLPAFLAHPEARSRWGWTLLRLILALLIAAHGWARLLAGGVPPFGIFLEAQGFPAGAALAWSITAFEIAGSITFACGRIVPALAAIFASIYALGIVLVHGPEGWFVVGLGRNGAEYSVLLIATLLAVGFQHVEKRDARRT